jgi:hypothetical protein
MNYGVGLSGEQNFYFFEKDSPANSFSSKFMEEIALKESIQTGSSIKVKCVTLEEILRKHLTIHTGDYLLDIDVEGLDYDVLTTFDFRSLLRPILISVEDTESPLISSRINNYLASKNYHMISRTILTSIYGDAERPELKNLTRVT